MSVTQDLPIRTLFIDQIGDVPGGAQRSFQLLVTHLPHDIEPSILLFSDGSFADELRSAGLSVRIVPLAASLLSTQRESVTLSTLFAIPGALATLRNAIIESRADLVYTNTVKAHFLGLLAARLASKRSVAHLRDILEGSARTALATLLRLTTKKQIAISQAVSLTYALKDTQVIPNPLDLVRFRVPSDKAGARERLGIGGTMPLVGIVGRINRWKGHDTFLRIAAKVANESDAHFVIVGSAIFRDSDFLDELRSLAERLRLSDRLHFVPWMNDPRDAYAALDVHCNTSQAEPFGRSIIEAAALGVPTVCFNDGGAPEAIAPDLQGDVVPIGDVDAFSRAVVRYVNDSVIREQAGRIARAFTSTFDPDVHAERVAAIIRTTAGRRAT